MSHNAHRQGTLEEYVLMGYFFLYFHVSIPKVASYVYVGFGGPLGHETT